jgi:NADPH-dependent glutamate synthase beta subunit-like oxidoreductase
MVVYAFRRVPESDYLRSALLTLNPDGTVAADPLTGKTDRPRTYAGGTLTTNTDNMTVAMATGKAAAKAIDRVLMQEDRASALHAAFAYKKKAVLRARGGERNESAVLDITGRDDPLAEVLAGLDAEAAGKEGQRCLRCDVKAACVHFR